MKKTKSERMQVSVSPEEKTSMEAFAAKVGLSFSAWARMILLAAMKGKK